MKRLNIRKIGFTMVLGGCMASQFLFAQSAQSNAQQVQSQSWHLKKAFSQRHFSKLVPPGNYSGITHLHDDVYAVVSDKADSAYFFYFRVQIDSLTGKLQRVENLGFARCQEKQKGFDREAIAKITDHSNGMDGTTGKLVIASEGTYGLKEYAYDDKGVTDTHLWEWTMPSDAFYPNYVFESAAYDAGRQWLWTIPESCLRQDGIPASPQNPVPNRLRLMAFDMRSNTPVASYVYQMDAPTTHRKPQTYVMGVSELCALEDGQLLVLEREAFVPKIKLGSFCKCKLYLVNPAQEQQAPFLKKRLLYEWKTSLSLFRYSFANYEGMCLGPKLMDGSQVIILLSDSQDRYKGVLKDWFKTIVIRKS